MVKVKETSSFNLTENWTVESWVKHLKEKGYEQNLDTAQYGFELIQLSGNEFEVENG